MMKEFKLDDINPVEEIKSKVWTMFDVLRSNGIGLSGSYVILLLMSLYKDNLISRDFLFHKGNINTLKSNDELSDCDKEALNNYEPIIQSMSPSLFNLSERAFKYIIDILYQIDREIITENFPSIFDSVLFRLTKAQGRYSGEFIQPAEITRFINSIADLPSNASVYNPFAGVASFGVNLGENQNYFGQEWNEETWALGALRLMAYNRYEGCTYECNDSIKNWPNTERKFDLIVSNPPYGIRFRRGEYQDINPNIRTIEQFLLEQGIDLLNTNGKLISVLPQSILYGRMYDRLRKYLIDEDLIDAIISLPGGLMYHTGISSVILVLNKNKKEPRKVRLIDSEKFITTMNRREKVLDANALYSVFKSDVDNQDSVRVVSVEQIIDNNYNLNIPRYFSEKIEGVKLGQILEFVRGQRDNQLKSGKLLRIRDLKDDKLDFKLTASDIEISELKRSDAYQMSESCLLLAIRWKTLKPTLFEYKDTPIYRINDVLSFKVDENKVDVAFLVNELHADYVQKQLESYRVGAAIPFIRKDDLMEVVIKLPSIEEQRAKVKGISELSSQIKALQEERNAIAHGVKSTQFNEFASLKHSIGAPRQNILSNSKSLIRFFENNQSESFVEVNKVFEQKYDIGLIDVFKEIKDDINHISIILEKGEKGLILEDYPKTSIPLRQINSFINELSENGYNFHLQKNLITDNHIDDNAIECNITLLRVLFDNILKNAHKYGFIDNKSLNEVVIDLQVVDSTLEVIIKNNGIPFPKNFNKEKFISKFSTADTTKGTGIGGYDINRIAEYFGDSNWILDLDPTGIYPVIFKFSFDIKLLK